MDTSKMRVPLQGAAKIFEAGLKSKTWDIHGMPQFIMTTHREGCETCNAYVLHVVKASGINGRNTVQGGQKGLPNSMAEHSSPHRG